VRSPQATSRRDANSLDRLLTGRSDREGGGDAWLFCVLVIILVMIILTAQTPEVLSSVYARSGILVACGFLASGLIIARLIGPPIHALSPIAVVAYCQALLFVARPLYQYYYANSLNVFTFAAYGPEYLQSSFVSGFGFCAMCVGFACALRGSPSTLPIFHVQKMANNEWVPLKRALIFVTVCGYALYSVYVVQTGIGNYVTGVTSGRSAMSRSATVAASGYFTSGLQFSIGALILLMLGFRLRGDRRASYICMAVLCISLYPDIAGGNRSVFIPVALAVVLVMLTTNPKVLSPHRVVVWVPSLFIFGIVAPRIWRDQLAEGGSLTTSIASALDPSNALEGFVGGLDTAMVDAFEVQIHAQSSGVLDYQMGWTYLGAIGSVIPRDVWKAKPESVDQVLNAVLFPALDAQGIGFSFGFYSEPYFNFGYFGIVVLPGLFGALLGLLTRRAWSSSTLVSTYILIMTTAYIFPIMRGSISFDAQRLMIAALPALIAVGWVRWRQQAASQRFQLRRAAPTRRK
jgi:hypothetical protein